MDADELKLFERSLRNATERRPGDALDTALDEIGWRDALAVDPRAAVSVLFGLQGATNATSSALDHVFARGLDVSDSAETAVVLPPLDDWNPPGQVVGERIVVRGLSTRAVRSAANVFVVARTDDRTSPLAFALEAGSLSVRPVAGMDPALGLLEVNGETAPSSPRRDVDPGRWEGAIMLGLLALSHELVGASRTMLDLARQHALERIQYGRPIATFQAVRHRLADALVAIDTAVAVLNAAWDDQSPPLAAMAKALAGRGSRTVARHCQQVLAGMGFTTEHPFHRYFRRILVLDQLLGSARSLTKEFGAELLRSRQLPALLPL